MMDEAVSFGSREYVLFLSLLFFSRGADFLSTWIATPRLVMEANPIARWMGWKWGLPINGVACLVLAAWPLAALIIATTSVMVAARNFQGAWLMRTAGEETYRAWMAQRIEETPPGLYLFCLFAQALLIAGLGAGLMLFSPPALVPFGIGLGIVAYALAIVIFTLTSLWKGRRSVDRH